MLVAEAKALGGNKVQLLTALETPKGGLLFKLATSAMGPIPFILSTPVAGAADRKNRATFLGPGPAERPAHPHGEAH